jgi:hypothetical protein
VTYVYVFKGISYEFSGIRGGWKQLAGMEDVDVPGEDF